MDGSRCSSAGSANSQDRELNLERAKLDSERAETTQGNHGDTCQVEQSSTVNNVILTTIGGNLETDFVPACSLQEAESPGLQLPATITNRTRDRKTPPPRTRCALAGA